MVLICISLMISDVEHISMCLLVLYVLFGEVSVQVLCSFFNCIACFYVVELCEFFMYFGY